MVLIFVNRIMLFFGE